MPALLRCDDRWRVCALAVDALGHLGPRPGVHTAEAVAALREQLEEDSEHLRARRNCAFARARYPPRSAPVIVTAPQLQGHQASLTLATKAQLVAHVQ